MGSPLKVAAPKIAALQVSTLLQQVHRRVHPLGPPDYLAAEAILRSRDDWTHGDLRASLASLLAHDAEQWQLIAKIYDEIAGVASAAGADGAESLVAEQPVRAVERPQTPKLGLGDRWRRAQQRLIERILYTPRSVLVGILATCLALVVVGTGVYLWQTHRIEVEPPPVIAPPVASEATSTTRLFPEYRLEILEDGRQVTGTRTETPDPAPMSLLIALMFISTLLMTLGCRLIGLVPEVKAQRRREIAERKERTDTERRRLEEEKALSGRALEVRYHVKKHLPVSRQALLDSAEILGRLSDTVPGDDLDADATLDRTIDAGGRFSPVPDTRALRHDVVVLIDVEEGNHPWLDGFRRVLDAWAVQGVRLLRYEFHMTPDSLVDLASSRPLAIDELARRTEGLPLLVFSRQLDLTGREGEAMWIGQLSAWPHRVWLDPDPRRPEQLAPPRRQMIFRLQRLGLTRFHLSNVGLVRLASWLEGRRGAAAEDSGPELPRYQDDPDLAEALRLWALVAALVPDPTWDQLDAIRRHFPELRKVLPEPRYLQCLLEWVEERTGRSAELGGGRGLAIPRQQQHEWLVEQRQLEVNLAPEQRFESRARQLLLDQLKDTRPKDPLDLEWWKFKNAMHRAVLEPERAAELLEWVYNSSIAHEASRWVDGEVRRQKESTALDRWDEATRERLETLRGSRHGVPLGALASGYERFWWRSLAFQGALGAGFLAMAFLAGGDPMAQFLETEILQATQTAPVYELVETPPEINPEMVTLSAGEFMMGSNEISIEERPVHEVRVASFQISKTEITVAQYRACVDAGACDEPSIGGACNWGKAERDDNPVNSVSWADATAYATWAGGRLPSEAEWEYAARSVGQDRDYPWGDEPADCDRAVVEGCSGEGTEPVCAIPEGNSDQGLCDMAGNVWEWVEDDWASNYDQAYADGRAWEATPRAPYRVIRGGSWRSSPLLARAADRYRLGPSDRSDNLGFRVARSYPLP